MSALHDAARRRIARLRGQDDGADAGFAMIFVLMITLIITVGVATTLVVTASNVVPARTNQDNVAALAAAQAGLDDYVAFLNANCATFNSTACTSINGTATPGTVKGPDNAGTETYVRQVLNPGSYLTDGFLRVKSTGRSANGATARTKTLVADLAGLPNVLRFAYMSKYESLAKSFVDAYYPARTIAITDAASASAADKASPALTTGSTVGWAAPTGTDICDREWYDDTSNATDTSEANPAGADADPAFQNPGRGTLKTSYRTGLGVGFDWGQTSTTAGTSLYQPCEVTFTSGMTFSGPVYSKDAIYLSYGTPGGTGPMFSVPTKETLPAVSTGWSTNSFPAAIPGQLYRQFPYILGAPSCVSGAMSTGCTDNSTVQTSAYDLQLPTSVSDAAGSATCIYNGPTRVVVNGATATIISPLTTVNPANPCYANTNASLIGTGVTSAQVPLSSTTIYVKNIGNGATGAKASAANPVFSLSTPASDTNPVTGTPTVTAADASYTPTTVGYLLSNPPIADGGWTLQWPSYSLLSALNALAPTCAGLIGTLTASPDLAFFNCNVAHSGYPDSYSYVKAAVKAALAANPSAYATVSQFQALVNSIVATGNTSDAANALPDNNYNASHRYRVSAVADAVPTDGCTPTSSTVQGSPTPVANPSTDKFLSLATQGYVYPQTQHAITCMTATVTLQVGTKNSNLNSNGKCNASNNNCGWGDGTSGNNHIGPQYSLPQFKVTARVDTPANSTHTTATTVAFPNGQDATQYATWDAAKANAPGDLYVEGTGITSKLSLVADNDIVVTGPLTTTYTSAPSAVTGENSWASGGAVALVANNNTRIYHPVSCPGGASATTTAGYCPNDISGLYSTVLTSGSTFTATHPAMQYCNLTTGFSANTGNARCSTTPPTATGSGAVTSINAVVFALNGSLMTDNYNRGLPMGPSTVLGGIYQLHRGATGQQWETQTSASTRAYSGYQLQDTYLAMDGAGLPYVPALKSGRSDRSWNIVSVSAG